MASIYWWSYEWTSYYEEASPDTKEAFEWIRKGAYSKTVSFNGAPPSDLFLCKLCHDYVTSSQLDLREHMCSIHRTIYK